MKKADVLVIGGGSAGVRAARLASEQGAKVILAESGAMGGTCVNLGCVPKKLYVEASQFRHALMQAQGFGWAVNDEMREIALDWPCLQTKKQKVIKRLNEMYRNRLLESGVELEQGYAHFIDQNPHIVRINDSTVEAERILLATGGQPVKLEIPGAEFALTSDDLFKLKELPSRALVIGSGYIGVEFSGILNGFGVRTDLAFRSEWPLKGFDEEVRAFLLSQMEAMGIKMLAKHSPVAIRSFKGKYEVDFGTYQQVYDLVLMATGRQPNTQGLGLEKVGVVCDAQGGVVTDTYYQTSVASIDALGDVRNQVALTPIAIEEAKCWVNNRIVYPNDPTQWQELSNRHIVTTVFSQPNVATIGLTQQAAEAQYSKVAIYRADFKPLKHSLTGMPDRCLLKLLVDQKTDKVIGLHIVSPEAGEIMQGFAVAIQMGATKADFDRTLAIHPTMAEELVTFS